MADRRALVIASPGSIGLRDVDDLVPGPGEVVARPAHVGICGTDLELLAGVVDPAYVRYPLVPGHEWSGVVEAVGPGVTGLEPGQPVIAKGIIPDRVCAACTAGDTNLCEVHDELGFTRAGAAADQVLVPDLFAADPDTGALSGRRRFVTVADGLPDGLTLDAEGCLWLAVWDSGELRRFTPDGRLDTVVRLPARQVTSAAFGGPDLDTLYITTAREASTPADLREQPNAGDVFACVPGVTGRPPFLFNR